jgi:hypothetical protein
MWCNTFINQFYVYIVVEEIAAKLLQALNKRFKYTEENKSFAEATRTLLDPR